MTIARVALPLAAATTFDYWIPEGLPVVAGTLVRVRLARRALVGVVLEVADDSAVDPDKLQPLESLVEGVPTLPSDVLALAAFVSGYYVEPVGLVLAQMLPPLGARDPSTRRPRRAAVDAPLDAPAAPLARNDAQQAACAEITRALGGYAPFALAGITGSGKTDVYLAAASEAIARGGQVLLLVPEINLTPQLEQRIVAALPGRRTVSLHSGLPRESVGATGSPQRRARPTSSSARGLPCSLRCRAWRSWSSTRSTIRRTSSRTASAITRATWPCGGRGSGTCRWCWAPRRRRSRRSNTRRDSATAGSICRRAP